MNFLDRALPYLSKLVIIIPIVLLIIIAFIYVPKKTLNEITQSPTSTPTVVSVESFSLNGEYVCEDKNFKAFIQKRKIYINDLKSKSFYLYRDDCLYTWNEKEYSGGKICGLSPYIGVFENLGRLQALNMDNYIGSIFPAAPDVSKISEALKSCSPETVKNTKVFEVPKEVLFKNTEKPWLRPTFPSSALE